MIRYISFDVDGTLVDDKFDNEIWWHEIPKLYAKQYKISIEKAKMVVYSEYYKSLYIEKVNLWTDIEYWFKRLGLKDWKKLIDNTRKYVSLYHDTIETLGYLSKKYNLIIISDANKKFLDIKLDCKNIRNYFDYVFTSSEDFGISQKNKEVFDKILKKLSIKSEEIVHIGDNNYLDYIVPSSLGIKSFYLKRSQEISKSDYIINSLTELKKKL